MPDSNLYQLFVVQPPSAGGRSSNIKVIVWAINREDAKRKARASWLEGYGDPDQYIVTPITNPGDRVKLDLVLNV